MAEKLRKVLARRAAEGFVGRGRELEKLLASFKAPTPIVLHLHGIAGIGKSTLVAELGRRAGDAGLAVVRLDCRSIEPTAKGFLTELAKAIGAAKPTGAEITGGLARLGPRVVLAMDAYEVFRAMDSWLRQEFVPALDDTVRVLLAGREPPVPAWVVTPGWRGLFETMELGPLEPDDSRELVRGMGVEEAHVEGVTRFALGHPLALQLAAAAIMSRPNLDFEQVATQQVMNVLTQMYLEDVRDAATREALSAGSLLRRITCPLLAAILPDLAPGDTYDRLQVLPFVEASSEGLVIHDAVRQALEASLKARDPDRHRSYQQSAWRFLRGEILKAPKTEVWRHSADLLFMLQTPIIREAFFPSSLQPFALEPAREEHGPRILELTERHEGSRAARLLSGWWTRYPRFFKIIVDPTGSLTGFYILLELDKVDKEMLRADPVARVVWRHLQDDPMPARQRAVFARRWLEASTGDSPSPAISACFLDVKGYYVAKRPWLRRLYCCMSDFAPYRELFRHLRFQVLDPVDIDGRIYQPTVLDFGPGLFPSWLIELVARDLGVAQDDLLDSEACELTLDDRRVPLTPLELGVMTYLTSHQGKVVSRATLLDEVWGYASDGGSNVVDARIAALRKKLGPFAPMIETVSGLGYRFRRM